LVDSPLGCMHMRACASPNALTPRTSSHPRARLHPTHLYPCASTPLRVYTPVHIRPFALTPERIHPRVRFSLGNFPCGFQRPLLVPTSPTGSTLPCWFQHPLLVPMRDPPLCYRAFRASNDGVF